MEDKLRDYTVKINRYIESIDLDKKPRELYQPVKYGLSDGGKRVRPLMALLACDLFGGDIEKVMAPATGMEIFHNFTLMHDDIMDQAPIRRGKPSVYKKWNANTAILSGDVMFAMAIEQIARTPIEYLKPVLDVFNKVVVEVCEGQQYDMNFEVLDKVTEQEYIKMIRLKTAVLPAACLKIGAIIAGATTKDAQNIHDFGENVGIAFQIKDDWLDIFGDEDVFGKKTGGDIVANKKTWLYIKAFEMANESQLRDLRDAFTKPVFNPEEKICLVKGVYGQLGLDKLALEKMAEYNQKAFDCLSIIKANEMAKQPLRHLAISLLERKI